jgi:hypothetical protein
MHIPRLNTLGAKTVLTMAAITAASLAVVVFLTGWLGNASAPLVTEESVYFPFSAVMTADDAAHPPTTPAAVKPLTLIFPTMKQIKDSDEALKAGWTPE